ncbi:MAG: hypothetical protein ABIP17_09140 [Ilumatobacteraceae bacterium]
MTADIGREAVYAAEIAAFEGTAFESLAPYRELVELAELITGGSWWPHGEIEVVTARSDASSSSTRQSGGRRPVVRLAAPQMTSATLVHEFAHVLASVAEGHGAVFRRAHVDLAGFVFGEEPALWLLDGYAAMGLEAGLRTWEAPLVRRAAGGPVAL